MGGEQYVQNIGMYAARSHLYYGIFTPLAAGRAAREVLPLAQAQAPVH